MEDTLTSKGSHEIIEYEISDSISLIYDKLEKRFYIYEIDFENGFDEYSFEINEPFDDMEFDETLIRKSDFEEFKELVLKSS